MSLRTEIIVISARIAAGERPATVATHARELLRAAGFPVTGTVIIPESREHIMQALQQALERAEAVITLGGTGTRRGNLVPEVTQELAPYRLHGIETQMLLKGLESTYKAGLSRGVVAVTALGQGGQLIANLPGSAGGMQDGLEILLPLLPHIFE